MNAIGSYPPAISAVLADGLTVRFGNDLRLLGEQRKDQLWQREKHPSDDLPPPTDDEPVPETLFALFCYDGNCLNIHIVGFASGTRHAKALSFDCFQLFYLACPFSSMPQGSRKQPANGCSNPLGMIQYLAERTGGSV